MEEISADQWREIVHSLRHWQDLVEPAWYIICIVYLENIDRAQSGRPRLTREEWVKCCGTQINAFRASVLAKLPELRGLLGEIEEYQLYRFVILPLVLPYKNR